MTQSATTQEKVPYSICKQGKINLPAYICATHDLQTLRIIVFRLIKNLKGYNPWHKIYAEKNQNNMVV